MGLAGAQRTLRKSGHHKGTKAGGRRYGRDRHEAQGEGGEACRKGL